MYVPLHLLYFLLLFVLLLFALIIFVFLLILLLLLFLLLLLLLLLRLLLCLFLFLHPLSQLFLLCDFSHLAISSFLAIIIFSDEYNRVKLNFMRGVDGSDYINASFIDVSVYL